MNDSGPVRRASRAAIAALAALPLLWAGAPAARGEARPLVDDYVIGVEDLLEVRMPDHPELSAKVPVRPDGRISLPLVDDVPAAGLSPAELKGRLLAAYRDFVTVPNISVMVVEVNSLKFYVLGEVAEPGMFDLRRPTRVLQAIAMAGGFTEYAAKDKVILLREMAAGQERFEIPLKRVYSGEQIDANFLLQPGDTVVVP